MENMYDDHSNTSYELLSRHEDVHKNSHFLYAKVLMMAGLKFSWCKAEDPNPLSPFPFLIGREFHGISRRAPINTDPSQSRMFDELSVLYFADLRAPK